VKTEAKVGLFITLSLFFLFLLLTQLSSFDTLFKKSYPILAQVEDGTGLKARAKVKLKGVDVGYVEKISLFNNEVQTKLMIDDGVQIPNNSIITISQDSLLGGKFIDIKPGDSRTPLAANQLLSKEEKVSSIADASTSADEAFKEIALLVRDLRDIFNSGGKSDIQNTLANLEEFSAMLASISKDENETIHQILQNTNETVLKFGMMSDEIVKTSQEFQETGKSINQDLPKIMARVDEITHYLNQVSKMLDSKLPTAMDKFVRLENNLNRTIENNNSSLNKALTSVDGFFTEGTETMHKIDKYLDAAIRSELHLEMRTDNVYDDDGYSKTHLNFALKPDPTRYYMLGLTSKPSFKKDESYDRGYEGNQLHESGDFLFSAQYGKRYDDLLFRVGLIENQGGFGIDYFALNDTLKLSTELSDFNAVNDVRGSNPNLTTTIRYQFFKHVNTYIAGNNLLNSRANSISAGVGVSFVDNDLKNLLGTAAAAAGN
jgi:phospholipid/cholesterol/gamma-HCH transport system substrate-binding protein